VKVEIKHGEGLVRELTVELPADTVNSEMEKAFADIRRKAEIKGFRKGHAPMNLIRSNYADQVKADVAEELLKSSYAKAVEEKTLRVASPPTVTALDYQDDGALRYTAHVEVLPEIEKVVYDGLELSSEEIVVEDSEVDGYLEYLRKQLAEHRTVERPATEDDRLVVDLKKLHDPNLVLKTDEFPNTEIDLANPMTVREFREHLVGTKAGEEKEIEIKYADDYPDKVFAGATIKYRAQVKAVKERILAEVNDGFAKQTKKAETLLELRLKLREEITKQKEQSRNRDYKQQIVAQVAAFNPIPVPQAMVDRFTDEAVAEFKEANPEADESQIRDSYREIGTHTLRWNLLVQRLAEIERIEVSSADTENVIKRFAETYQTTPEKAKEFLSRTGKIADIRDSLIEEKVIDFLVSKARVVKTGKGT
jgi:trigger factor